MTKVKVRKERCDFIDDIQNWFRQRNMFWGLISFISLLLIIILQVLFILLSGINPHIRTGIDSLLVPLLVLFPVSIFWRGSTTTILSLSGVLSLYVGMFYVYADLGAIQVIPSHIVNRLEYASTHAAPTVAEIADFYFFMGIFAIILSMAVAFRPSIFRAKGNPVSLSYPVWTSESDPKLEDGASVLSLIPVQSLLTYAEHHMVTRYKYIQAIIGRTIYFVSPDDWVPQTTTYIVRDKNSGSLVGIPKVPDGFNLW
jgi:hypothetical protein